MNLYDHLTTELTAVIKIVEVKQSELSGFRPPGYENDIRSYAIDIDEEHGLIWLWRKDLDYLRSKYRKPNESDLWRRIKQLSLEVKDMIYSDPTKSVVEMEQMPEVKAKREEIKRLNPFHNMEIDAKKIQDGLNKQKSESRSKEIIDLQELEKEEQKGRMPSGLVKKCLDQCDGKAHEDRYVVVSASWWQEQIGWKYKPLGYLP